MMQAGVVNPDLERSIRKEPYLVNNTVHSFGWLKISVHIKRRASDVGPEQIITNVDGFTKAGKLVPYRCCIWLLTMSRRAGSHNGPIWFRKNDSAQRTR